jgi:DHA1 family inner membrane transport protein
MTELSNHHGAEPVATPVAVRPGIAHAALALGGYAIGTAEFAAMSFLPAYSADLRVDAPTGGYVVSAYALGVVVGAPLLAVLGARFNRKWMLVLLLCWFALGNALSAAAPNVSVLFALRFLTAIPHGYYFGAAILAATEMVSPELRGSAVARIMMGLALSTVTGVPLAAWISAGMGWRYGFALLGVMALFAALMVWWLVPQSATPAPRPASKELGALLRPQVWFSLSIGAVGFGGLFAVYTYLTSTLQQVTKTSAAVVPLVLAVFGAGLAAGNVIAPYLARRGTLSAAGMLLAWSALALAIYPETIGNIWAISVAVFAIGCGGGLGTVLQMRLMEVAGHGQSLAASLNHAAFNAANALGPWLAGLAIAAGLGWASTGFVGCILATAGLAVWLCAVWSETH